MPRRSSSARLIGRDRELADLVEAVQRDDDERRVVLVAGEAGIGKTRLLAELIAKLHQASATGEMHSRAVRVVRGSCLQIGDGDLPFAPVLEILDALRADPSLSARANRLRAVLAGAGDQSISGSATARMSRFLEIHDLLVAASGPYDLVVMIDDLHWADQSTLDLLLFLARRVRESQVVIVAAYRSDELHRRHPLRPVLAELNRGFVRARIELGPLDVAEVVAQITELRGDTSHELARRIADRADGNPFHVEELVALDIGSGSLPDSLRDVLLMRVAALDPTVARVLGACAVVGQAVDERLLSLVLGLEVEAVSSAIATAVDRSILVPSDDGRSYRFRHALLAEAVDEDLLPAARVDLHRRIARVLRDQPELRSSAPVVASAQLALHLDRAGEFEAAIDAYVEAAGLAFGAVAWAEGIAAFERASELVAIAPGIDPSDPRLMAIVTRVAFALDWSGEAPRAMVLLGDWIARVDAADSLESAVEIRMALSRIYNGMGEEAASRDMADQAARLVPPDEHTAGGLDVLLGMASTQWIANRLRAALDLAERAVAGAEQLGDPRQLVRALAQRGMALLSLGHVERGLADFGRVDALQAEHGWLDDFGVTITNLGAVLLDLGLLDLALDVWVKGFRTSRELDNTRSWDPWNLPGLALTHYLAGRWHDADRAIEEARSVGVPGMPTTWRETIAARLAADRGDVKAADRSIETAAAHSAELEGDFFAHIELARARRSAAAGDHAGRLDHVDAGIRLLDGLDDLSARSSLTADGAGAAADLIEGLHGRRDKATIAAARERARGYATLAADIAGGRLVPGADSTPWWTTNASLAAAEAGRAAGSDDPAGWPPIAAAFAALGMRPRVAYVQFRHAAALLQAGDRDAAAAALGEARDQATDIGMHVLLRQIGALSRAGRLDLRAGSEDAAGASEAAPVQQVDHWGLSDREQEVLALVAAGRTNGEIGAALFISTKTASVHVTHILDKLGVSSRTEAALLASRSGVVD